MMDDDRQMLRVEIALCSCNKYRIAAEWARLDQWNAAEEGEIPPTAPSLHQSLTQSSHIPREDAKAEG